MRSLHLDGTASYFYISYVKSHWKFARNVAELSYFTNLGDRKFNKQTFYLQFIVDEIWIRNFNLNIQ